MMYKAPYLEKYAGRKSRHECPKCHDKFSFTRYIDGNTGREIHPNVGRCDHESRCGCHYTPKEYFKDNPTQKEQQAPMIYRSAYPKLPIPKEAGRIPKQYLIQSLGYNSNFVAFLCSLFDQQTLKAPTIERLMQDYYIGHTRDKSVIYWQVDINRRIRTGKIMQYDAQTGKRIKNASGAIDWVHARLKRSKILPDDFNLVQCLFGEHLLSKYPNRVVALVESEKSALIGYGIYPQYVWLATGGKSQLSAEKLKVLKGRTVCMFPDVDAYPFWCEKANEMKAMGINIVVSDALEKNVTSEERAEQIDVADWFIRELKATCETKTNISEANKLVSSNAEALQHLVANNPNVQHLIDALDLVIEQKL